MLGHIGSQPFLMSVWFNVWGARFNVWGFSRIQEQNHELPSSCSEFGIETIIWSAKGRQPCNANVGSVDSLEYWTTGIMQSEPVRSLMSLRSLRVRTQGSGLRPPPAKRIASFIEARNLRLGRRLLGNLRAMLSQQGFLIDLRPQNNFRKVGNTATKK